MGFVPLGTSSRLTAADGLKSLLSGTGRVRSFAALPESVDLSQYAVPAGDQGPVGSCAAWSTGYTYAGWLSNYQHHVGQPFAPMYVYNQINRGVDNGSSTASAWRILEEQGVPVASAWSHPTTDYLSQPTASDKANAAAHKLRSHQYLFVGRGQGTAAETVIKTALASNMPVEIAMPIYTGFSRVSSPFVWRASNASGSLLGGHAMVALGYDSTGLKVENSWGPTWGANGWVTLAWDLVDKYLDEASVSTGFVQTGTVAAPAVVQVSPSVASTAGGASLVISGSGISTVDTASTDAVTLVSSANSSQRYPATVTAHDATTLTVRLPAVPTAGTYHVIVTGSGGTSVASTADVVTLVALSSVSIATGTVLRTTGGPLTLIGTGFGTSASALAANRITATVNGSVASVTWVDDTHVKVTVPPGSAGATAAIVLSRQGLAYPAVSTTYVPPSPKVTAVSPNKVGTSGGTALSVAVTGVTTVPADATTVTLVNVATPSVTVKAKIAARSGTGLTVTAPPAPVGADGKPMTGAYRVVVTGTGGTSEPNGVLDQVTYLTSVSGALPAGTIASATGGGVVTLVGSGFGASQAAFAANRFTATVGGLSAALVWVDDSHLKLTVPAGKPGTTPSLVLFRDSVAAPAVPGPTYVAVISGSSAPVGPLAGGWKTNLTGVGFSRSTGWALVDSTGATVAALKVVDGQSALSAAASGVVLTSDTSATVKLPAAPGGRPGSYRLVYTLDPTANPGGVVAFTSKAMISYSDLG